MTLVSAVSMGSAAILDVQVTGLPVGTSQLQVTGVNGPGFGTLPGAVVLVALSTTPVSVVTLTRSTPAAQTDPVSVSFDSLPATSGCRCSGYAVGFAYSTPAPPVLPPVVPTSAPTTTPPVRR